MLLNLSVSSSATPTGTVTASATVKGHYTVFCEVTSVSGFTLSTPPAGTNYDPKLHEITYIWTVRGSPLSNWTAPQNMVSGWNNPNKMYGGHCFFAIDTPGTYTIDLTAYGPNGVFATWSDEVTIADPDVTYSGTNTLCLALDSDFTGKPTGAAEYTTLAALNTAISGLSSPSRVLFKRGETIAGPDDTDDTIQRSSSVEYLGAWGSGADPIIQPGYRSRIGTVRNPTKFTIHGLDFQGKWDAATETGHSNPFGFFSRDNTSVCWYHYHKCSFSGFSSLQPVPSAEGKGGSGTVFSDTVITNWRDYGIYMNGRTGDYYFGVIGCRIQQDVDALNGGTKNGLYNNHGPVRFANIRTSYFSQSDLFSRNGWSPLAPDTADQPCVRANSSPDDANNRLVMDRMVLEGGFQGPLALESQNSTTTTYDANYVIDKVVAIGVSKQISRMIRLAVGGTTLRNIIGVMPNVPQYHSNGWDAIIELTSDAGLTQACKDSPIRVYNCTFVNQRNTTNDPSHDWTVFLGGDTTDYTAEQAENNITHAPDIDTPRTEDAPVDLTTAISGVIPRYKGVRFNFDHEEDTLSSDVLNNGTFTLAYPAGTNQSYWQAISGTDTSHTINGVGESYFADNGEMSVSYDASVITVTNTSGVTWPSGSTYRLRLDRKSLIPAMDSTYANPSTVPLPRPTTGSAAINDGDTGLKAYDDFELRERPASGNERGALIQ